MTTVWVLTSGRTGDDKQSLRLADALDQKLGASLDFRCDEKKIVFNHRARTWRLMLGPSLDSVDAENSSSLEGPWPDMVISTGWRQVPVVRFIKEQSGGRTRLVQMNRPPGPKYFDLVLSPPQYEVPGRPNIVRLDWPLQLPPDAEKLRSAAAEWKQRLEPLPHPWTVLLLGGQSYPFMLDQAAARRLFEGAETRAREAGGSLLISTSRRTPAVALEVFRKATTAAAVPAYFYEWSAEAIDNPYFAFLAGGDEFVVTPDSISMLVEVARLGRPLAIAPHSLRRTLRKSLRERAKRFFHGSPERPRTGIGETVSDLASLLGLKFGRDLASVSQKMIAQGWAADFPSFGDREGQPLPDDDFDRLVDRATQLLES